MHTVHGFRGAIGVLATLATLLLAPAASPAAVVEVTDAGALRPSVVYRAAAGEVNAPTFAREGSVVTVSDPSGSLRPSDGTCDVAPDGSGARCAIGDAGFMIVATLGDGDDRATIDVPFPPFVEQRFNAPTGDAQIDGGPGDDVLTGSDTGSDLLSGGPGDDRLTGRGGRDALGDDYLAEDRTAGGAGDDTLDGGEGDDVLFDGRGANALLGGGGNDRLTRIKALGDRAAGRASIDGGDGLDLLEYDLTVPAGAAPVAETAGATIVLSSTGATTGNGLPGDADSIAGVEDARGTFGRDRIVGSAAANQLFGFDGDDFIRGGAGEDFLGAGYGADRIEARDGFADNIQCADLLGGDDGDVLDASPLEDAISQCPPPPDRTAPDLSGTRIPRAVNLRALRRSGLRLRLASGDAAANRYSVRLSTRRPGTREGTLARRSRSFTRRATVRLTLSGRARRLVRRGDRLRLALEVRDSAGNAVTLRRVVRVR